MNKKVLASLGGAIGIFIVALLALSFGLGSKTPMGNSTTPPNPSKLEIAQVLPKTKQALIPIQQIAFQFNQPIKADGFFYTVSPAVATTLTIDTASNIYTITPKKTWASGKTTIVIDKKTTTSDNKMLRNNYSYSFTSQFPNQEQFTEKRR